ncbi:allantoicase [Kibdelosporangium philippinense]|uniref:Probable allantoicase n=1 Tax=Kibdelosporangium philippinense TaxID=211113 RepID=A0ABS8Z7D9_9PSEU|nr:allantoicase [Kibdelosporangium philippinense]MCE7002979.1 allantoicase [Kibdelosporangium philippinense]
MSDLAANGTVMAASDEFFADKENLLNPAPATFQPHTFTPKGQQYDGWETRRRFGRAPGHDWVLVRLGSAGIVRSINVDTAHFLGNYPESCSVEGTCASGYPGPDSLKSWFPLVQPSPLKGGSDNVFDVDVPWRVTHVRLNIFPDGGVARLRVFGNVVPDPRDLLDIPFDLVALRNGGTVISSSDGFFSPPSNMLQPGESRFMADGWETARRRSPAHDWATIKLACPAVPVVAEISTKHYRGNSPDRIALSGSPDGKSWSPLLPETKVQPDTDHRFRIKTDQEVSYVRLESHPDGGIARFRLYGKPTSLKPLEDHWTATTP